MSRLGRCDFRHNPALVWHYPFGMTYDACWERTDLRAVKTGMQGIFTCMAIAMMAVPAIAAVEALTIEAAPSKVSRVVISQDVRPKVLPTPAVVVREVPKTDMRTAMRCENGACVSVSVKTRLGATSPDTSD